MPPGPRQQPQGRQSACSSLHCRCNRCCAANKIAAGHAQQDAWAISEWSRINAVTSIVLFSHVQLGCNRHLPQGSLGGCIPAQECSNLYAPQGLFVCPVANRAESLVRRQNSALLSSPPWRAHAGSLYWSCAASQRMVWAGHVALTTAVAGKSCSVTNAKAAGCVAQSRLWLMAAYPVLLQ
jgi:hypothetical protein